MSTADANFHELFDVLNTGVYTFFNLPVKIFGEEGESRRYSTKNLKKSENAGNQVAKIGKNQQ